MNWYVLYRISPDFSWKRESFKGESAYKDAVDRAQQMVKDLNYDDVMVFTPSLVSKVNRSMETPVT